MNDKPEPFDITCYVDRGWAPRLRPAGLKRDWMDQTGQRYAYRCLPLAIANAHGWELGAPAGFSARWNGDGRHSGIEIRPDAGAAPNHLPTSIFGSGVLTFHVDGIFRTPPGWNLWVSGPPNEAKDGIAPLSGVIETDWSPYSFTMNWRFTRPDHWVRFEPDETFCFFFPVQRGVLDTAQARVRPMTEAPDIEKGFHDWKVSRDSFQEWVLKAQPKNAADQWQKLYFRGLQPDGSDGPDDHQSRLRVPGFDGATTEPICPVAHRPAAPPEPPKPLQPQKPRLGPASILAGGGPLRRFNPDTAVNEILAGRLTDPLGNARKKDG